MLKSQVFTSSGTFTVPAGVSCVWITGNGGGGQGLDGTSSDGVGWMCAAGGSAGYCFGVPIPVTPGGSLAITVGAAGVAGRTVNGYTLRDPMATGGESAQVLGAPGTYPGDSIAGPLRIGAGQPAYLGISVGHPGPGSGGGAGGAIAYPEDETTGGGYGRSAGARFFGGSSGGRHEGTPPGQTGGKGPGNRPGGSGGSGGDYVSSGGGASSAWGNGGNGGNSDVAGGSANGYGAGGGGSSAGSGFGGNGSPGRVVVMWAHGG